MVNDTELEKIRRLDLPIDFLGDKTDTEIEKVKEVDLPFDSVEN